MLVHSSKYKHDLGGKYEPLSHAQTTARNRVELDYTVSSVGLPGLVGIIALSQEAVGVRKVT